MTSHTSRIFRSEYRTPAGAKGEARIYGDFPGCLLLGSPCTIKAAKQRDGWNEATDALGFSGVFARTGLAIHVSGRDDYGQKTGPGFVRGLARYSIDWLGSKSHPSGLGCHKPEPAAIVTCDGGHRDPNEYHRVDRWTGCDYVFTLAGVLQWARTVNDGKEFTPVDILTWIDAMKKRTYPLNESLHIATLRRLLEGAVGVSNNGLKNTLHRSSRWRYVWTP